MDSVWAQYTGNIEVPFLIGTEKRKKRQESTFSLNFHSVWGGQLGFALVYFIKQGADRIGI